jgi:hypothetical protein
MDLMVERTSIIISNKIRLRICIVFDQLGMNWIGSGPSP